MKNYLLIFIAFLLVTSCSQQIKNDEPSVADKWNGYEKFLKTGEQVHNLLAGQYINVGTVTYGVDENANFYATYNTTASGWTISETHFFAGDKKLLTSNYCNKPGSPKVGRFPYSTLHNPGVYTVTYTIPLSSPDIPEYSLPGFVVAAHCVVTSPSGQIETAWAGEVDGVDNFTFTDKDWGWYNTYFYNQQDNKFTILYATAYVNDTLKLFHLDVTNGSTEIILKEYTGENSGRCDAAAYDVESGLFFFANYTTKTLMANQLKDTDASFTSGILQGTAASATFYNGEYYYVNEDANTINKVSFDNNWQIADEVILDTIPSAITVYDITMNPDGTTIYMIGEVSNGGRELISWNTATEDFFSLSLAITTGAQIAYGNDGVLYVVAAVTEGGSHSLTYNLDPATGTLTEIQDDIIIIDDPFSDMSMGPIM